MESSNPVDDFLGQYKIPLAVGLVGGVLLIGGVISSGIIPKTFKNDSSVPLIKSTQNTQNITPFSLKVDVSGAVVSPGVYTLPSGARMEEALKAAGGITETADQEFVAKNINLAQKVTDGMKIYVPDITKKPAGQVAGTSTQDNLININEASLAELDKLAGVGAVTAQKIVDNRPYTSKEELTSKKVVSQSVYDKIKDRITLY